MAQKYYDSQYSGREIDIALQAAAKVAEVARAENAGKILQIDPDGAIIPADATDTALTKRVQDLEAAISGLIDGDEVSY